jgi:hypothetical protein
MTNTDHARKPRHRTMHPERRHWERVDRLLARRYGAAKPVLDRKAAITEQLTAFVNVGEPAKRHAPYYAMSSWNNGVEVVAYHSTPECSDVEEMWTAIGEMASEEMYGPGEEFHKAWDAYTEPPAECGTPEIEIDWESVVHDQDFSTEHLFQCPDCARSYAEIELREQRADERDDWKWKINAHLNPLPEEVRDPGDWMPRMTITEARRLTGFTIITDTFEEKA